MKGTLYTLFGEGEHLDALQMGCRAFVLFFITLLLIRLAGMRAFSQKSAFDSIVVIMLGAILSRAVVGASPFGSTLIAGAVFAGVHRLLAVICIYNNTLGYIIKGRAIILFKDGQLEKRNMLMCSVSYKDIMEEVRLVLNESTMDNVKEVLMERSGKISVLKKEAAIK